MKINESTFRKILREEARRTLREAPTATTASGAAATPVSGTPASTGVMAGPVAPGRSDAALKSVKAASGALRGTLAKIDMARLAGAPKSNSMATLTTAISWIPDNNSSAPFPAPTDPKFVDALNRVQVGQNNLAKTGEKDTVGKAMLLLAAGDSASIWGNWADAVSHFVPGYNPAPEDPLVAGPTGTLSNQDAQKFVNAVKPSAAKLVQDWTAFLSAMNEYKAALSQTNLGFDLTPPNSATPYSVVKGDTVAAIAQRFYGIAPSNAAMPIYQALVGQGNSPNAIKVGQQLSLPKTIKYGGKEYTRKA